MSQERSTQERATQPRVTEPPATGLRPRKGLFIILCIAMALWIGALVTMYFTTVWPERRGPTTLPQNNGMSDRLPTIMNG